MTKTKIYTLPICSFIISVSVSILMVVIFLTSKNVFDGGIAALSLIGVGFSINSIRHANKAVYHLNQAQRFREQAQRFRGINNNE